MEEKKTSTVLSILDTWPEYYEHMDEGIGTTYERFILHNYFQKLKNSFDVQSILETPSFGMTGISGINSLWWSKQGIIPTVIDNHQERIEKSEKVWAGIPLNVNFKHVDDLNIIPFGDNEFDMSWNFAALWFVSNLQQFISNLCSVTKKVIFICVPNANGIGFILRTKFNNEHIPDFFIDNVLPKNFIPFFETNDWYLNDHGYLDIPPWPDIAMKKENMLKKAGLGFLVKEGDGSDKTTFEKKCIVEYFDGSNPGLEQDIMKYNFLEKSPFPIKQVWGHHRWFIFKKS
jgi:Methyltransferase domain